MSIQLKALTEAITLLNLARSACRNIRGRAILVSALLRLESQYMVELMRTQLMLPLVLSGQIDRSHLDGHN